MTTCVARAIAAALTVLALASATACSGAGWHSEPVAGGAGISAAEYEARTAGQTGPSGSQPSSAPSSQPASQPSSSQPAEAPSPKFHR
ncbi:MAG: hypothetical protein H6698_06140 [Myxococcales bacterium]|nr:hypothetical protein [Myxococcales bacterium]MCB9521702.1 hypothetical protein [Myxococcales bacterium]MCB9531918.1 hypothetical protein [Myxococcales bacterium]MCB9533886.1 hypothetical protein [Myxococcales bacterium]